MAHGTKLALGAVALSANLGACAGSTAGPEPPASQPTTSPSLAPADLRIEPDSDPSIAILDLVASSGTCTRLDRMPGVLAGLPDPDYRVRLGTVAAEGRRQAGPALTEWLVLATRYQALCGLEVEAAAAPAQYISGSTPIETPVIERAISERRCAFLAEADAQQTWPYEVRMGEEVLVREFNEAEVTRRQWKAALEDYLRACDGQLGSRERVRAEAAIERLDRMTGLDDPTLIELRSNLVAALESGDHEKVLTYARAVAERESALDAKGAAQHQAKLAALEGELRDLEQGAPADDGATRATDDTAPPSAQSVASQVESWQTQVEDVQTAVKTVKALRKMAPAAAVPGARAAQTAADLARRADVARTAAKIVRKLF